MNGLLPSLVAAGLLASTAACGVGQAKNADGAYQRGVEALAKRQPRTARIEFLNAIKADPGNGRIRILQATTYLALGDGVAAEAEIRRARQSGMGVPDTAHLMAHALLLQSAPQRALQEAALAAPAHGAYAARMRGRALQALGDSAGASQAFDAALAAAGADSATWTDVARFRRELGELGGALVAIDRAVQLDSRSVEALILKGELTRGQYGLAAAIPWFDRALQIDPSNVPALLERAATLGDIGRMQAMLADTRLVLSIAPANPVAFYLQSVLAARARKFDLARSLYRRTGGAMDEQPAAMLLASAIDLETGATEQAAIRLGRLVDMQPDNRRARRLLAAAQWRRGDARATVAALRPLADLPDADSYVLTLTSHALAKLGETGPSAAYLSRAINPQPAAALLGGPVDAIRLAALRSDADVAPGEASRQIPLIRALLASGIGGEALVRARRLQASNPGVPDAHLLVGDALGILGDFRGAAEQYRTAANIAFTEPVAMRLIEALGQSGNAAGAAQVLALFLQQNPRNLPAQLLAANSHLQGERWDEAIAIYEALRRRIGDRDATLLNNLAWAYSETGDYERGIPLAKLAWNLDRGNPATADTLGWLLLKSGVDKAQGLALLEQAARGAPGEAAIRRRLDQARSG